MDLCIVNSSYCPRFVPLSLSQTSIPNISSRVRATAILHRFEVLGFERRRFSIDSKATEEASHNRQIHNCSFNLLLPAEDVDTRFDSFREEASKLNNSTGLLGGFLGPAIVVYLCSSKMAGCNAGGRQVARVVERESDPMQWTSDLTMKLLESCRAFQLKHGSQEHYLYSEIVEEFHRRSGVFVDPICVKNKLVNLRKQWRLWKAFWHKEEEMSCTPVTGLIVGTERMWRKKFDQNPNFAKFNKEGGVAKIVSDMWDAVFGDESNGQEDGIPRRALPRTNYICSSSQFPPQSQPPLRVHNISDDKDELLGLSIGRSSTPSMGSRGKGISRENLMVSPPSAKRARTSSVYDRHLTFMQQQTSGGAFSGPRTATDLGTSSGGTTTPPKAKECLDILDEMVADGDISIDDPVWAFTVCQLRNWKSQQMFLDLNTSAKRLTWMKFYYTNFEGIDRDDE